MFLTAVLLMSLVACGGIGAPAETAGGPVSATHAHAGAAAAAAPSSNATAPTTTATSSTPACTNDTRLAEWTVARLAEQTVVVPVNETDVASVSAEVAGGVGGVILFGGSAPASLAADLKGLIALAPNALAPFVMTDEEGGAVQRMANLVGGVPSARVMGATMTPAEIRQLATQLGRRMRAAGVTMDLAPVLDVDGGQGPSDRDPDGTRSFSTDPSVAAADGLAFLAGLAAGGIVGVVKHFPGLGGSTGNTDAMSAATPPWSTLQRVGLVPFEDAVAAHAPAVMVANATVPGLTSLPASISPAVTTGLLRDQLGYNGLVITDSLSSTAIAAAGLALPEATVAALVAGADMVLYTAAAATVASLTGQVVSAVVNAVSAGRLAHSRLVDAVAHILGAKGVSFCY